MRHATDPDHLIAVATIVSRERSLGGAALIGLLWGIGHTLTLAIVGGAIIVFGIVVPPRLGLGMELSAAVMLIVLGVLAVDVHGHPHGHADGATPLGRLDRAFRRFGLYHTLRPLVVGGVHGLAGSAAVALLVLATIPSAFWALAYLLVFGAGTIAGMMLITAAGSVPFVYAARRPAGAGRVLGVASGLASLGVGLFLVYRIGLVDGLLAAAPRWTPH
jgi:high-affinity nickel-transport protein